MFTDDPVVIPWLKWVVLAHFVGIFLGVVTQVWLLLPFCLWTETRVLQLPGLILWITLSLSPVLGLLALKTGLLQWPYLLLAAATPVFLCTVLMLHSLAITQCDAP